MPSLLENLKRQTFWIVARVCFKLYRSFPLFGSLRASIAIIHRDHKILVIQRNDGRGVSLPGGIAGWKEPEEITLRREVLEETGLSVTSAAVKMTYHSSAELPCNISVFTAEADGELQSSWEGSPCWLTIEELEPRLIRSQRPALELMKTIVRESGTGSR